ncbi:MAG: hypothetical protein ACAH11_01440 [Sphingomonas sp.]
MLANLPVTLWPVIYVAALLLLSWLVSRYFVRRGKPVVRAALCVAISTVIVWAVSLGLQAWLLDEVETPFNRVDMNYWIVQAAIPLAVFLWKWRTFKRRWVDYEKVFE